MSKKPLRSHSTAGPRQRSLGTKLFLSFLTAVGVFYGSLLIYHLTVPAKSADELAAEDEQSLLELCREFCLTQGLLPTGHVANDAKALLKATGPDELTGGLVEILSDPDYRAIPSQEHVLLGREAPDFELLDHEEVSRTLKVLAGGRPTVVVFYYGYGCSHCVAQLFGINRDLHYFREMDARVIALSDDAPEQTREKYAKYGAFDFPVLSDPKNAVAREFGVLTSNRPGGPEFLDHGTFVISAEGKVLWAYQGTQPFLDNRTLLSVIAESRGIHPRGRTRFATKEELAAAEASKKAKKSP